MSYTYCLELLVEPWAASFYKAEPNRSNDNAGYDLFCEETTIPAYSHKVVFIDHGVRARMLRRSSTNDSTTHSENHYTNAVNPALEEEVHYRLVPRSSICKTPLYMANSEGIIDRTYRGPIKAPVKNEIQQASYKIELGTRLFQIVAPDLGWIKEIRIVETLPETVRGEGGFGSTGI
jgi:dUTPase